MADWQRLTDPAPLPAVGRGCAWSGDYLAVCHDSTQGLSLYRRDGQSMTKLADPPSLGSYGLACAWSGDNLAVVQNSSPYVALYRRSGDTLTRLADPSAPAGQAYRCAWNGDYLAVAHRWGPYLTLYKLDGDALVQLAAPALPPGPGGSGYAYDCAWNANYLAVACAATPYLVLYRLDGDTLTRLADPTPLESTGLSCAWSGSYLAVGQQSSPYLALYRLDVETLTRLDGPTGGGYKVSTCTWSGDSLAVGYQDAPYGAYYQRSGDTLTPGTWLPDLGYPGINGAAWSGSVLATTQWASPYLVLYEIDDGSRTIQIQAQAPEPISALAISHEWDINSLPGQTIYTLTLTGAADELADITLPISSFQGRLRDGSPSYLQVTVPAAALYAEAVAARPNGQLVLRKGVQFADGSRQLEEIARVNLGLISDARGPGSQTLTLSGHRTVSAAAPKTRAITGIRYRSAGSGKRRYRCAVDLFLRPGDTAEIPEFAESVTVGLITYVVSANPPSETMEISEA